MNRIALLLLFVLPACEEPRRSPSPATPTTPEVTRPAPVPPKPAAAARTPASAKAGAVIVRKATSNEIGAGVRVRCAPATERLIGGGCKGIYPMRGWPFGYASTDTIGAGWECKYRRHRKTAPTTAYALCQVLERRKAEAL
jgi:hypothetical protein